MKKLNAKELKATLKKIKELKDEIRLALFNYLETVDKRIDKLVNKGENLSPKAKKTLEFLTTLDKFMGKIPKKELRTIRSLVGEELQKEGKNKYPTTQADLVKALKNYQNKNK